MHPLAETINHTIVKTVDQNQWTIYKCVIKQTEVEKFQPLRLTLMRRPYQLGSANSH